jgi:hypothetical protein
MAVIQLFLTMCYEVVCSVMVACYVNLTIEEKRWAHNLRSMNQTYDPESSCAVTQATNQPEPFCSLDATRVTKRNVQVGFWPVRCDQDAPTLCPRSPKKTATYQSRLGTLDASWARGFPMRCNYQQPCIMCASASCKVFFAFGPWKAETWRCCLLWNTSDKDSVFTACFMSPMFVSEFHSRRWSPMYVCVLWVHLP